MLILLLAIIAIFCVYALSLQNKPTAQHDVASQAEVSKQREEIASQAEVSKQREEIASQAVVSKQREEIASQAEVSKQREEIAKQAEIAIRDEIASDTMSYGTNTPLSGNVRFFRVIASSVTPGDLSNGYHMNIGYVGETLCHIWHELRDTVRRNRRLGLRPKRPIDHSTEFEVSVKFNGGTGRSLESTIAQLENDLYNEAKLANGPFDGKDDKGASYDKAARVRASQWDSKIAMLVHMWLLYERIENMNRESVNDNDMLEQEFVEPHRGLADNRINALRSIALHATVSMNSFIDAADEEGLAHLAGLIVLYMRVMDSAVQHDKRYVELRKAFAAYDPALLAVRWQHIELMCSEVRQRYTADNRTPYRVNERSSCLSKWARDELNGRYVLPPIPPECAFHEPVDPSSSSSTTTLVTAMTKKILTANRFSELVQTNLLPRYELRFSTTMKLWRPPPMSNFVPTSHLSRVVSTNGICYDLATRLDDHKWRGFVCYMPRETRHGNTEPSRYVDHLWYEADVTSIVLLDGTRYVFADNTKSSTDMTLCLYRAPLSKKCNSFYNRTNLTVRNRGGFLVQERHSSATASRPYDEVTASYYDLNFERRTVLVQTMLDQSDPIASSYDRGARTHEYAFDEHNGVLMRIKAGRRVAVCVQHKYEADVLAPTIRLINTANSSTTPEKVNDGMYQRWLKLFDFGQQRTFVYKFNDDRYRCTNKPHVFASLNVESDQIYLRDHAVCDDRFKEPAAWQNHDGENDDAIADNNI